ncbi:MAG: DUF3301 domain-containing protein [Gammaproteobacteria bacterium]|nr:MAG: DUF3301 domain-containing protein [Gammaproteobacteria bacterium]
MIELNHFLLVGVITAAALYWWSALAAREVALRAVRRHCEELDLQILDDGLVLRRIWMKRDGRGRQCLWRTYHFEFSVTGGERYHGQIVTLANRVEAIHLPPYRSRPELH